MSSSTATTANKRKIEEHACESLENVFKKIEAELEHQRRRADDWDNKNQPLVEAELLILTELISEARGKWLQEHGSEQARDIVRKIAGVAVRCLYNHGCPERDLM